MYCIRCGNLLKSDARFCGKCGRPIGNFSIPSYSYANPAPVPTTPPVVTVKYIKEEPMESILDNGRVLFFTFFIFILSIATIFCVSYITKDLPATNHLQVKSEEMEII